MTNMDTHATTIGQRWHSSTDDTMQQHTTVSLMFIACSGKQNLVNPLIRKNNVILKYM